MPQDQKKYNCEEKLRNLFKILCESEGYEIWDKTWLTNNKTRDALATKARKEKGIDYYTLFRFSLFRFSSYDVSGIPEIDRILNAVYTHIERKPALDLLLCNDHVITALQNGELSLEFILTLTNDEARHALDYAEKHGDADIVSELHRHKDEILSVFGVNYQNAWRLVIDQKSWDLNDDVPYRYDFRNGHPDAEYDVTGAGERGYLCAALGALSFVAESIEKRTPISVEFIETLHKCAIIQVILKSSSFPSGGAHNIGVSFDGRLPAYGGSGDDAHPEMRQKVTAEDLEEILTYPFADVSGSDENRHGVYLSKSNHPDTFLKLCPSGPSRGYLREGWTKNAHETMQYIIDQYQEAIQRAKTPDEKILAITRLGKMIDTMHPFGDGNIRTVVLLMNKLLVENGLLPTCMPEPNNLDCKSSRWNAEYEVKPGQETFKKIALPEFFEKREQVTLENSKPQDHGLKKISNLIGRLREYLEQEKTKNTSFDFFKDENHTQYNDTIWMIALLEDATLHLGGVSEIQNIIDQINRKLSGPSFKVAEDGPLKSFYLEAKTILEEVQKSISETPDRSSRPSR